MNGTEAFGRPGIGPTWTSSDKDLVTTALGESRLWATFGHGIVNEVYWPSTGEPQIRDLGFIVAGRDRWREVKRDPAYTLTQPRPFVPLPTVVHSDDDYRLTLEYLPDSDRDVLLIRYRLEGAGLAVYALLAPHLDVGGDDNVAWVASSNELFAESDRALCLAALPGFRRSSAGYVGRSDGWQDFAAHGSMTWTFDWAGPGNVALMGELVDPEGVLALALAARARGAQVLARSSLADGFDAARTVFVGRWEEWAHALTLPAAVPGVSAAVFAEAQLSTAVLKVHDDPTYPGAVVASLSIPWGSFRNDPGGYHLVWPRDAVQIGLAMAGVGQVDEARNMLAYLVALQQDTGAWAQNTFSDGTPFWTGIQLDEVAFPVVLAARLAELDAPGVAGAQQMIRQAAAFIVRTGPVTQQDRWEENEGISPFTLALSIAALVAAADSLGAADRDYAGALADSWNECIEEWTYTAGSRFADELGVAGHYVRIAPPARSGGLQGMVDIHNRWNVRLPATELVGMEFLYLVRLGLRQPDDQRIVDSLTVAEAELGRDLRTGRAYLRYNEDGYGEAGDGAPFFNIGQGRPWPLLVGERGHYALSAGEDPTPYLETMLAMSGPWGMLPEQVWDGDPIPERGLQPGEPTGGAMPLVWAHAEFVKLLRARQLGQPLERLRVVDDRYHGAPPPFPHRFWRASAPFRRLPADRGVTIEDDRPFVLHFGFDGWQHVDERESAPLGFGMHGVRFEAPQLVAAGRLDFTRRYRDDTHEWWEGQDHSVQLA